MGQEVTDENLKFVVSQLSSDFYGNGKDGMLQEFRDHRTEFVTFMAIWEDREKAKDKAEEAKERDKTRRDKKIDVLLYTILVLATVVLAWEGWKDLRPAVQPPQTKTHSVDIPRATE